MINFKWKYLSFNQKQSLESVIHSIGMDSILFAAAAAATSCAPPWKKTTITKCIWARNNHHMLKCVWPWFHSHIMSWKLYDVLLCARSNPTERGCQTNFMCVIGMSLYVCVYANNKSKSFTFSYIECILKSVAISSTTHSHTHTHTIAKIAKEYY